MALEPDLLKGLAAEDAARLLALGTDVTLAAGESLFRLGDAADQLFVVQRGRLALTLPMIVRGREEDVLVEEKLAGETVGWSGLVPPHRFTLNAAASVDSALIAFRREALLGYFDANPAVGYVVTKNVAAVIGHRLIVFQAMWLREMQRLVEYQDL